MTCMKTGAEIYIDQYGEWAHCDAFVVNGVAVFRIVQTSREPMADKIHYTVHSVDEWFDKDSIVSTLISTLGGWTNHGFDGMLVKDR